MNPMKRRGFMMGIAMTTLIGARGGPVHARGQGVGTVSEPVPAVPESIERLQCGTFVYGSTPGGIAAVVETAVTAAQIIKDCDSCSRSKTNKRNSHLP